LTLLAFGFHVKWSVAKNTMPFDVRTLGSSGRSSGVEASKPIDTSRPPRP
jgi:hypothetical protein